MQDEESNMIDTKTNETEEIKQQFAENLTPQQIEEWEWFASHPQW